MPEKQRFFAPIDFKTRFPALDGIRALAVTLVFANHFGGGYHGGIVLKTMNHLRLYGWIGVDLFFVLSGFLITGILYDTRNDSQYFKRFFARRAFRILPVFYVVAALLLLLTPVFHYQWHWLHLTWLIYMANFFANNNWAYYSLDSATHMAANVDISHLWSLCVEEQFYLLWPIAVLLIRNRIHLIRTAAGLAVLALVLRYAMFLYFPFDIAVRWNIRTLPMRMDSLLIGAILALVLRGPLADRWQRSAKWILLGALVPILVIFNIPGRAQLLWTLTLGLPLLAIASFGLIGSTLRTGSPAFRLFYLKPLRTLGKYSYGFYVFHLLFSHAWVELFVLTKPWVHSLALNGVLILSCNYLTVFLVSKLSYDLIEVRFLRLKRHFEYDSELTEHKHAFTIK